MAAADSNSVQRETGQAGYQFEETGRETVEVTAGLESITNFTVHVIPQSHIDLVWFWSVSDGIEMILETFRGHAQCLEADSARTFCQSQAAAYEIVLHEDPELFERIKRLVANRQWEVVGGEWVEADTVIPGPEARIRQYLLGQRFFLEHFGKMSTVGWSPDAFVMQPRSLPQFLRQSGMEYFVHKRPREKYQSLPSVPYRWIGPDGSEVLCLRANNKGNGVPSVSEGLSLPDGMGDVAYLADLHDQLGLASLWGPMGVGDTGGTNDYCPEQIGVQFRERYSTAEEFWSDVAKSVSKNLFPEVHGDLRAFAFGSLTTWFHAKQLNRRAENELQRAESLLALAACRFRKESHGLSAMVSRDRLHLCELWKRVLYLQFHDVAGGCGTEPIRDEAESELVSILAAVSRVLRRWARVLAESVDHGTSLGDPILVVNPLGFAHDAVVEMEMYVRGPATELLPVDCERANSYSVPVIGLADPTRSFYVTDGAIEIPATVLRYARQQRLHKVRIRFTVPRVEPFAAKIYYLAAGPTPVYTAIELAEYFDFERGLLVRTPGQVLPNGSLESQFEAGIVMIWETGDYTIDYGKEHRAWQDGLREKVTVLTPEFHTTEQLNGGRVRVSFHYRWNHSRFVQRFLLGDDRSSVESTVEGDWQEMERYLKIGYRFTQPRESELTAFCDQAYGFVDAMPVGLENPIQYLCGLRDDDQVFYVFNDSRYGARFMNGILELSAVRCASFPADVSDRGEFSFSTELGLVDAAPGWRTELVKRSWAFNVRTVAYAPDPSVAGITGDFGPPFSVPPSGVSTIMKPAEDGDGVVFRVFNPEDHAQSYEQWERGPITAENILEQRLSECPGGIGPHEIQSWRFPDD